MQPHGGTAGPAVVEKRHRALFGRGALLEVGGVEHARGGRLIVDLRRQIHAGIRQDLSIQAERGVLGIA